MLRNLGGRSTSSSQREAVAHVMFQTGSDLLLRSDIGTFESADERDAHHFSEIWILTKRFPETRPAWIASEIEHGREAPRNSGGASFECGDLRGALHQFRIERCRHADLLREKRRVLDVVGAVNRVDAVDHRNAKSRFLGCRLDLTDDFVPPIRSEEHTSEL